jgi:hypothetical protein
MSSQRYSEWRAVCDKTANISVAATGADARLREPGSKFRKLADKLGSDLQSD